TAFLEMAKASGLQLLKRNEQNPWKTTTVGTGEMIRAALDAGCDQIVLGVGGSAANDGGMGMATALGVRFFDATGQPLAGRGADLLQVERIDASNIHPRLSKVRFTIFCDVDNPLMGQRGAAHVFAPQK